MTRFQKPADIKNLSDLKRAKKAIRDDIQISLHKLEGNVSDIPNRLLGRTVAIVGGAIAFVIVKRLLKKKPEIIAAKASSHPVPVNFGQTLKNLGGKTAWFVVTKVVEKLLTK